MQDQSHFVYIQPTKDGWCARYFDVISVMDGRGGKDSSRYYHKEIGRYFYSTQKSCYTGFYEWKNFFQTGEMRFCKVDERFSMPCKIYPKSLNTVRQKDSRLRYIPLEDIATHIKEDACLLIDAWLADTTAGGVYGKDGIIPDAGGKREPVRAQNPRKGNTSGYVWAIRAAVEGNPQYQPKLGTG